MEYEDKARRRSHSIASRRMTCANCGARSTSPTSSPSREVAVSRRATHGETGAGAARPVPAAHLIGTGGMGGVYYAKDETLGRFVAIKVMLQSLGEDAGVRRDLQARSPGRRQAEPSAHRADLLLRPGEGPALHRHGARVGPAARQDDRDGEPLDQALVMQIGLDIAEGLRPPTRSA